MFEKIKFLDSNGIKFGLVFKNLNWLWITEILFEDIAVLLFLLNYLGPYNTFIIISLVKIDLKDFVLGLK